jgi:hypothetical protein
MRRRWWGAAALTAATVTGALVVQGVTGGQAGGSAADDGKSRPVKSSTRTAQFTVAPDGTSAELGKRDTASFSMLGLTWSDPSARVNATIEARTRDAETGTWSKWLTPEGVAKKRFEDLKASLPPAPPAPPEPEAKAPPVSAKKK